jgi:hypothetical protein
LFIVCFCFVLTLQSYETIISIHAVDGNCNIAAQKIYSYTQQFNDKSNPSLTGSKDIIWTCLGPTGRPDGTTTLRGNGQIHRITFNPGYNGSANSVIYAATMLDPS